MTKKTNEMRNPLRHPRKLNPDFFREHADVIRVPLPLYQCKDGSKTTDITKAELDPFGRPMRVGYSKTEWVPAPEMESLCLDPADPAQRLRAIEARSRMENVMLPPTIYEDSIEAVNRSNNLANKVLTQVSTIPPSSPAPAPATPPTNPNPSE